ncbi:MAG: DUF4133 domain-containing protein [Pseudobacter sp.]|uniref:DUF4133 domain-containing protein n=1 Tax=Pseudobacter sp. TaxID=2045420 RepID=UPI003F7F0D04
MAGSVYTINKGVNRSIEFKGLKAQYIWYLGGGLVLLLVLFAILYVVGINSFVCILIIFTAASFLFYHVFRMSRKYGEHGMMKAIARRSIPPVIRCKSRKCFVRKV